MNKVRIGLFAFLLGFSVCVQAQIKTGAIKGRVVDETGKGIVSASVSLVKHADSSVLKTVPAGKAGEFAFENISFDAYVVRISSVGYSQAHSERIVLSSDKAAIEIKPIALSLQSNDLKAVTVVSRKPLIEQKIDRTIINVDAAVTSTGSTALEVLEKSPGVYVDKDGNISLKGKSGVVILIDGRPAYISGAELANMLKGMQASQLDQIEIMTNPPAKYDAAGNSGVINIKTKKNKAKGFNGSITAGVTQGKYFRTNESLSLNYRKGKVNLFSNYSFAKSEYFQELSIFRRYTNDDNSTRAIFEQTAFWRSRRSNNNLKIGMDYSLDQKTTIGVVVTGFYNPQVQRGTNTSFLKDPSSKTDSIVRSTSSAKEIWKNGSVNLNMSRQFDSTDRELTADIDVVRYAAGNQQNFLNASLTSDWTPKYNEQLRGDLPIDISIYSGKIDYTHPLKKGTKIEFGVKSSYVITDSKANYFEAEDGLWQIDYKRTNFFEYKENINAAYVNFNKQLTKKLGVQTGLRFENTNYSGYQYGNIQKTDSSFTRTYNGVFPTVYFSYAVNKTNQFGLSFGRRIDRPAYQDLNPFMFFIDKYTYGQGNPYLRPQYSNNVEVSHNFKGMITTTVNYSVTKNLFAETFDQEGEYATIVRRGNIGRRQNAGISVNAQVPFNKWLSSNLYANYNYSKFTGLLNGEMLDVQAGNLVFNLNNQIKLGKQWNAEVGGWYRTKGVEGQLVIHPMGQFNVGVSKQVMKGKGSVRLNVRDMFYTQVAKGEINFKSTEASFVNKRDTRGVNMTFTYRFGKPINGNGQRKKGGAGDEQNRVKTGE